MFAGLMMTRLLKKSHLPDVTAYLIAGVLIGPCFIGALGIPGLYVTGDPGGIDEAAKVGALSISLGTGWAKSLSFTTGQCPVMKYNRELMMAILHDRVQIAKAVNAEVIPLEDAPRGYQEFDQGAAKKYVLNPNGLIPAA